MVLRLVIVDCDFLSPMVLGRALFDVGTLALRPLLLLVR